MFFCYFSEEIRRGSSCNGLMCQVLFLLATRFSFNFKSYFLEKRQKIKLLSAAVVISALTLRMLGKNFSRGKFKISYFSLKTGLTFDANCFQTRQIAWNAKLCFLGKIIIIIIKKKQKKNTICVSTEFTQRLVNIKDETEKGLVSVSTADRQGWHGLSSKVSQLLIIFSHLL